MLRSNLIARLLDDCEANDPLVVTPKPDTSEMKKKLAASVDLRLGTWFLTKKARSHPVLDIYDTKKVAPAEKSVTESYYIPFGKKFILHPRNFVLAVTLEWIRLPLDLAGMVTGKSSWGRRGLVIETAPGIHPGFTGCLTLELTNLGEIPISISPGMKICQLFLHNLQGDPEKDVSCHYIGRRRPSLGTMLPDEIARKLGPVT